MTVVNFFRRYHNHKSSKLVKYCGEINIVPNFYPTKLAGRHVPMLLTAMTADSNIPTSEQNAV